MRRIAFAERSALVPQEGRDFVVCSAQVEYEGIALPLENQPQVQIAVAFREWADAPQSYRRHADGAGRNLRPPPASLSTLPPAVRRERF